MAVSSTGRSQMQAIPPPLKSLAPPTANSKAREKRRETQTHSTCSSSALPPPSARPPPRDMAADSAAANWSLMSAMGGASGAAAAAAAGGAGAAPWWPLPLASAVSVACGLSATLVVAASDRQRAAQRTMRPTGRPHCVPGAAAAAVLGVGLCVSCSCVWGEGEEGVGARQVFSFGFAAAQRGEKSVDGARGRVRAFYARTPCTRIHRPRLPARDRHEDSPTTS